MSSSKIVGADLLVILILSQHSSFPLKWQPCLSCLFAKCSTSVLDAKLGVYFSVAASTIMRHAPIPRVLDCQCGSLAILTKLNSVTW
jgi:hypothetical protein